MNNYNDINTMSIERLLYLFERRMDVLLKQEAKVHEMDAVPSWIIDKIENEIMPAVEYINSWEPSDEDIINFGNGPTMAEMHEASRQQKKEAWAR